LPRCELFIEFLGLAGAASPISHAKHFNDAHTCIKREGENIAFSQNMASFGHAVAVQAHMAAFNQGIGISAMLHKASVDQPFVKAL